MKWDLDFFSSTPVQAGLLGLVILISVVTALSHHGSENEPLPQAPDTKAGQSMPQTTERRGIPFPKLPPPTAAEAPSQSPADPVMVEPATDLPDHVAPLTLFAAMVVTEPTPARTAPYGRLIPCETVVTLESNRLETPVVGRVTEDIRENDRIIVPAGTEVHGRAALNRVRERIAVEGAWTLVWRTDDSANGTELRVQGLALARDSRDDSRDSLDGSAGLPGEVIRSPGQREQRLFAASFLAAATSALQDTRTTTGPWGEQALPAATLRNATLAGSGAILRDYANQIRDAIDRDGFFLRVPAGTPFYLYLSERLDLSRAHHPTPYSHRP
jgi:hypothetical protein